MEIETERLFLREFQEDDHKHLTYYNRDSEARRYLLKGEGTAEHSQRWVTGAIAQAQKQPRLFFSSVVILKERDEFIGKTVLVKATSQSTSARIGWELDRRYWSRGYMTEAMQAVIIFGLEKLCIKNFYADCFAANKASIRVMEKLGMKRQRGWLVHPWFLALRYRESRPIVRYRL